MSTETQSSNGLHAQPAAPDTRVRFGPRPDDTMPLSWGEDLLKWLKTHKPLVFAEGMLSVMGIDGSVKEARR